MAGAFLIALRDGLEAALIVGIICAYLVKLGRRDALPKVILGAGLAALLSLVIGVVIVNTIGRLDHRLQATLEGIAAVAAVVIMTRMLFWMRAQGRAIKGDLESQVSAALALGSTACAHRPGVHRRHPRGPGDDPVLPGHHRRPSRVTPRAPSSVGSWDSSSRWRLGWAIFAAGVRINLRSLLHGHRRPAHLRGRGARGLRGHASSRKRAILPQVAALFDVSQILPQSSAHRIGADGHVRIPGGSDQHPGRRRTCCTWCRCCSCTSRTGDLRSADGAVASA